MSLEALTLAWIPLILAFYFIRRLRGVEGTGILTAYLASLCALHWIGGLIRLAPWFHADMVRTTYGLEQGTYGLVAFIAGSLLLSPIIVEYIPGSRSKVRYAPDPRLPQAYLLLGIFFFFLLSTFLGRLPSMAVMISAGQSLYVAGICLLCWKAILQKNPRGLVIGITLALMMPLITIVLKGFMGYGAASAIVVFAFIGSFSRRSKMLAVALIGGYLGLSVYITYMRDRSDIRRVVWGGQSFGDRFDRIGETAQRFEWFDPRNVAHLQRIDNRMNQDWLVGAGVLRLSRFNDFAEGETLWQAVLSLVPRAIWPEKAIVAGGSDLVSRYTGLTFARDTSVGVGQVLEFYINFGTLGVVLGFMILGAVITTIDVMARRRLLSGDQKSFVLWFLLGVSLLQPGGYLVETSAGAAASVVIAILINRYLLSGFQKTYAVTSPTSATSQLRACRSFR